MFKNFKLILAALVAILSIGAASFAVAGKAKSNCCDTHQPCCQTQQPCCR